jgi:hypothetical protein
LIDELNEDSEAAEYMRELERELGPLDLPIEPTTPELEEASAIIRAQALTRENWIRLHVLARATEDDRIGDLIEAFMVACRTPEILDRPTPEELANASRS